MAFAAESISHGFSRSDFHATGDDDNFSASESNVPSFPSVHSRLSAATPSVQSTVKVEGRKEIAVDRFKVSSLSVCRVIVWNNVR